MILAAVLSTILFSVSVSAGISESCISCIGDVEDGGSGCNWDVGSLSCGRYQIKEDYWIDCYKPGTGWKSCATDDSCARECITSYMNRYGFLCAKALGKSTDSLTCYDYGRLHNGGPNGCSNPNTLNYVSRMKEFC